MLRRAAISIVLCLDIYAINATIAMVNTVFNTCSIVCELAVTSIFSLPLKYPLNTDAIETKNIDGERATSPILASGILRYSVAIVSAPRNNARLPKKPKKPNKASAILNIL